MGSGICFGRGDGRRRRSPRRPPGKAVAPAPVWKAAAPAVRAVVTAPAELPITSRAALLIGGGEIPELIATQWRDAGYQLPRNPENALPPNDATGCKEIVIVGLGDQRDEDLEYIANQLRQRAVARGVDGKVLIRVGGDLAQAA